MRSEWWSGAHPVGSHSQEGRLVYLDCWWFVIYNKPDWEQETQEEAVVSTVRELVSGLGCHGAENQTRDLLWRQNPEEWPLRRIQR